MNFQVWYTLLKKSRKWKFGLFLEANFPADFYKNLNKLYLFSHHFVGNEELHIREWKDDDPCYAKENI